MHTYIHAYISADGEREKILGEARKAQQSADAAAARAAALR